jgi:hypothetical protein
MCPTRHLLFALSLHQATKICSTINCLGSYEWQICAEPDQGWYPSWQVGLCVGAAMLALLLSLLCFFVLRSNHLCKRYLAQQLETNRLLSEAKEESEARRRETESERDKLVLLMREYEGGQGRRGSGEGLKPHP